MKHETLLLACLLGFAAAACTKESVKTTFSRQETLIENFLSSQLKRDSTLRVVSNGGSERLVLTAGEGEELRAGGTVSFYYAGYILTGSSISSSNLFATNYQPLAESAGWNVTDSTSFAIETLTLAETDLVTGLRNGLMGVQGGEECYILFSGKYGFGRKVLGTIPANAALAYHIWVESLSND